MKSIIYVLRLSLVLVLLISFNSCENETINEVQYQEGKVTIEYFEKYTPSTTGVHYLDLVANCTFQFH